MYCVRGIKGEPVGIGRLERFVADWHNAHSTGAPEKPQSNGHQVAVVGSGPPGLTCAGDLAKKGYEVTVFEALHLAGGVLVYGIPEFRLPKTIVQKEVDGLKALGVTMATNIVVGRTITIDELMEENGFEAVFIGSGAGLPMFMNIPGVNLKGVLFRQRVPDPYQPDEGLSARFRHPHHGPEQEGGCCGRRQRGYGRRPLRQAPGRRGLRGLSPRHGGAPARKEEVEHAIEEGHHLQDPQQPRADQLADEKDNVKSMTLHQDGAG